MPMANLDPSFELGKRLSGMEQRIRSMETKSPFLWIDTSFGNEFGFTPGTTLTSHGAATLSVPQGYSQVLLNVTGQISVNCQPPTGTAYDWLASRIHFDIDDGAQTAWSAALTEYGSSDGSGLSAMPMPWVVQYPSLTWIFTGLQFDQTITVGPQITTGLGWTSNPDNYAGCNVSALFMP